MAPKYARDFGKDCAEGRISKADLIRRVLEEANWRSDRKGEGVRLGETAIRALYRLHKKHGLDAWISLNQMDDESGIRLGKSPSRGLYIWKDLLGEQGRGVVQKKEGHLEYRIVTEFYDPVQQVLKELDLL